MISVIEPGRFTSFQDRGRSGFAHLGVPQAGAADSMSLRHANLLVGNGDGSTALEMTLSGPTLRFETNAVIAFAGGRIEPYLDDMPLPMYQSVAIRAGQVLACGPLLTGVRCYLAIAGGFSPPATLASTSSDTFAALGPPVLRTGDRFACEAHSLHQGWYLRFPPEFPDEITLRVIQGPHDDWFSPTALAIFLAGTFEVRADSDRTGLCLSGERIHRKNHGELPSQGMVTGAVQIPGDGHPIALLTNHGTVGGYPVIAVVIHADLSRMGQLRAGAKLRFHPVGREQALTALRSAEAELHNAVVSADPGLLAARSLMVLAKVHPSLRTACLQLGQWRVRVRR
ncbi:MAG TPA: biotin-dependent carboxyltransferase family protein [Gammaproteobacteria bacterium]|nr:biotin-dependent carboxyltransferase family protein [Gammaproteobacteria bacterium]